MRVPFRAVALTYHNTPVEIRELLYLAEPVCRKLLGEFREVLGIEEAMVFSTCNRTEVYYLSETDRREDIISVLCIANGVMEPGRYAQYFETMTGREAVHYLFRVSMGLESSVLGDLQIAGQVKQAYALAHEANMAGAFLHRMMHTVFHANKRVQQETAFRDGAASVSYAATELARESVEGLEAPRVLVVGLGQMGRDVAANLHARDWGGVVVCNRTWQKSLALSAETGAQPLPWELLASHAGHFEVVISALTCEHPILLSEWFGPGSVTRTLIDVSVPRSVDPALADRAGITLLNVDSIHARTQRTLERRRLSIPEVERIVAEEVASLTSWSQELSISPTIQKLKEALETIRQDELARYLRTATPREAELLEAATKGMVNKFMKLPVLQLKEACKRGEQDSLIEALHEVFNLERVKA